MSQRAHLTAPVVPTSVLFAHEKDTPCHALHAQNYGEERLAILHRFECLIPNRFKAPIIKDFNAVLKKILDHPSIAAKTWVWEQYDHMVRTDTVFYPGHDAALIRIKGTNRGIAVATDCNSLYCYLDPYEGGKIAVAEAARNVVATGAVPLAITNCLNFGNPMKPEVFWTFHQAVQGMVDACQALKTPVTGGNVSLYNESPAGAIQPTPTVGMVGLLENIETRVPSHFQNEGDLIFLLGESQNEIGGSHYLMIEHGLKKGLPPRLHLEKEIALQECLLEAARGKILNSCHDLSEGGLAVAVAEACLHPNQPKGAVIDQLDLIQNADADLRIDAILFGETQSRAIISVNSVQKEAVIRTAQNHRVPIFQIGKVGGQKLVMGDRIEVSTGELKDTFQNAIPRRMQS